MLALHVSVGPAFQRDGGSEMVNRDQEFGGKVRSVSVCIFVYVYVCSGANHPEATVLVQVHTEMESFGCVTRMQ